MNKTEPYLKIMQEFASENNLTLKQNKETQYLMLKDNIVLAEANFYNSLFSFEIIGKEMLIGFYREYYAEQLKKYLLENKGELL